MLSALIARLLLPAALSVIEPYTLSSNDSILFGTPVERDGFHFQVMFGLGGGPDIDGLHHAMEIGGTLENGWTIALLHTFVQNKGILGPERGPDLMGGWMAELKAPIFFPEIEAKIAFGFGGLHDQSDGIVPMGGVGWAYGVDFHIPVYPTSGITIGFTAVQVIVQERHYFSASLGTGYTWF